jgi:hypothetical protein
MYAVNVSTLVNGFRVSLGVAPAAMVTTMVSPTARLRARMNEATTPGSAAGSTILVNVDPEDPESLSFEAVETPDQPPVELAEN